MPKVSQRLKRTPTILDKLKREPTMALSTMADIGGCRAVLNNVDELRRVQRRWEQRDRAVRTRDYIVAPRDTGYRAVHIIVQYDERLIEVQLRTRAMHEWAFMVETVTGRLNVDVKGGRGPDEVQRWFKAVSEAMAIEESGGVVSGTLAANVTTLREQAEPLLKRGWQ
ncbi:RelA/SpoT domain-containing protein [Nocardia callitridis]